MADDKVSVKMENSDLDYGEYLDDVAAELLEDEEWELPKEARFLLAAGLPWGMLFI